MNIKTTKHNHKNETVYRVAARQGDYISISYDNNRSAAYKRAVDGLLKILLQ